MADRDLSRRFLLGRAAFAAAAEAAIPPAGQGAPGAALTVLIIRHAEKPGQAFPGPGLSAAGTVDAQSLVVRGWQRAGAWAALFGGISGSRDYPRPTAIYAANPQPSQNEDVSERPFETVLPLAAKLNISPNISYTLSQESQLAAELNRLSGVVLICWEHKAIANSLLPAMVGSQRLPTVPRKWDGTRFDIVLRFDRADASAPWTFRELFPKLLSGDTNEPMA